MQKDTEEPASAIEYINEIGETNLEFRVLLFLGGHLQEVNEKFPKRQGAPTFEVNTDMNFTSHSETFSHYRISSNSSPI